MTTLSAFATRVAQDMKKRALTSAIDVRDFGVAADGTTDDTSGMETMLSAVATFGIRRVIVPAGVYRTVRPLTLSASDVEVVFDPGATIRMENAAFESRVLTIAGSRCRVVGGRFESPSRNRFIVTVSGSDNVLSGAIAAFSTKSTMPVVPSTSIHYHRGAIEVQGSRNTVERCEAANTEGAGIYLYGDANRAVGCYTHDNCTGLLIPGSNASVLDCVIADNNVNTAEGYDGILSTGDGLTVRGNLITGSGEHGTYVQGKNISIEGNTVRSSHWNGIKVGNVDGVSIIGNKLADNNVSLSTSEGQIYVQRAFKRVTILGNTETSRLAGYFIRAWSLNTTDEVVTISGNVGIGDIAIHAARKVSVTSNITDGALLIGFADAGYPVMASVIVAENIAARVTLAQSSRPSVRGNTIVSITVAGTGVAEAMVKDNQITGQNVMIPLRAIKEFTGNSVWFTMTNATDTLFQQDATVRNGARFLDNEFISSGGRFLFFTSELISPNDLTIIGNSFSGVNQPLYFWGSGHQIIGNRSTHQIGFLGCNNSIITGNVKEPAMRAGVTGNVIANNTP